MAAPQGFKIDSQLATRKASLSHCYKLLCTSKSGNTLEIYTPLSLGGFSRKSEKLQRNLDFSEV